MTLMVYNTTVLSFMLLAQSAQFHPKLSPIRWTTGASRQVLWCLQVFFKVYSPLLCLLSQNYRPDQGLAYQQKSHRWFCCSQAFVDACANDWLLHKCLCITVVKPDPSLTGAEEMLVILLCGHWQALDFYGAFWG